jgi:hypothetical protein
MWMPSISSQEWCLWSVKKTDLTLCLHITHLMLPLFPPKHHFSVNCFWNSLFSSYNLHFFFYFYKPWILFRKWPISHKTYAFNNYNFTAQECSMLQALSLNCFNNKTQYRKIICTRSQCRGHNVMSKPTASSETANWETHAAGEMFLSLAT